MTRSITDTCSLENRLTGSMGWMRSGSCRLMFRRTKKIIISQTERRASGCWSLPRNPFRIFPDIEIYFIIGADSLYQLESWYHPEQVMAQSVLLVSGRTYEDGGVSLEDEVSYLNKKYGADIRILHNPKIEEASADIRKRAALGEDLSKDTPEAVANYFRETGLYRK